MSGEFVTALAPTGFKANLSLDKQNYVCACGLRVGVGVDKLDPAVSILSRPDLLCAAHQRHHQQHFGGIFGVKATLYMIGGKTPDGVETLSAAQCSCDYDKEHPLA